MTRILTLSFLLLFFVPQANAASPHIKVPNHCQVVNITPGYCLWACLETSCRYQGIKAGYCMVGERTKDEGEWYDGAWYEKNLGTQWATERKLRSLGIKYKMSGRDQYKTQVIKEGLRKGKAVTVNVRNGLPTCDGYHAILLTMFDEEKQCYRYIDTNEPWCEFEGEMDWFWANWDGFAIFLE